VAQDELLCSRVRVGWRHMVVRGGKMGEIFGYTWYDGRAQRAPSRLSG
jgi:uncharacterized membrane protein YpjA